MTFHYIIVGAGSAGCDLANRLSANPRTRVCLVEAGPPDRNPLIHMPLGLAVLARSRRINWGFTTEPEPALNHRRLYWPRGRVLGGSSSINAMIYMRGHPQDYRDWARAAGDLWDWPQVSRTFREMEDNRTLAGDLHGRGGGRLPGSGGHQSTPGQNRPSTWHELAAMIATHSHGDCVDT